MNAKHTTRKATSQIRKSAPENERLVTMTLAEAQAKFARGETRIDRGRLDALSDQEIERAVAEDPDAPALLDDTFWRNAQLLIGAADASKSTITIRIDDDVLSELKRLGPGYQSRINAVLRAYTTGLRRKAS